MHRDLTPGNVLIAKIRDGGFLSVVFLIKKYFKKF